MECSRSVMQNADLIDESFDNLWVTVTLIDARVAAQVIKIFLSIDVPQMYAQTTLQDSWQRRIVVASHFGLALDDFARVRWQRVKVDRLS